MRRMPLTAWERPVFSQFGEDGVIAQLVRRTGEGSRSFVEFGVETGLEANSVFLANVLGWTGVMLESTQRPRALFAGATRPTMECGQPTQRCCLRTWRRSSRATTCQASRT